MLCCPDRAPAHPNDTAYPAIIDSLVRWCGQVWPALTGFVLTSSPRSRHWANSHLFSIGACEYSHHSSAGFTSGGVGLSCHQYCGLIGKVTWGALIYL